MRRCAWPGDGNQDSDGGIEHGDAAGQRGDPEGDRGAFPFREARRLAPPLQETNPGPMYTIRRPPATSPTRTQTSPLPWLSLPQRRRKNSRCGIRLIFRLGCAAHSQQGRWAGGYRYPQYLAAWHQATGFGGLVPPSGWRGKDSASLPSCLRQQLRLQSANGCERPTFRAFRWFTILALQGAASLPRPAWRIRLHPVKPRGLLVHRQFSSWPRVPLVRDLLLRAHTAISRGRGEVWKTTSGCCHVSSCRLRIVCVKPCAGFW